MMRNVNIFATVPRVSLYKHCLNCNHFSLSVREQYKQILFICAATWRQKLAIRISPIELFMNDKGLNNEG
jgi:hypothetical protein